MTGGREAAAVQTTCPGFQQCPLLAGKAVLETPGSCLLVSPALHHRHQCLHHLLSHNGTYARVQVGLLLCTERTHFCEECPISPSIIIFIPPMRPFARIQ